MGSQCRRHMYIPPEVNYSGQMMSRCQRRSLFSNQNAIMKLDTKKEEEENEDNLHSLHSLVDASHFESVPFISISRLIVVTASRSNPRAYLHILLTSSTI